MDRVRRLPARADHRRDFAGLDSVRGRTHERAAAPEAGVGRRDDVGDRRDGDHRPDRRSVRGRSVRLLDERGAAARSDPVFDRRGGDLRVASRLDAVAQARADARGRVWPERSGGGRAGPWLHRCADPAGIRRGRFHPAVRPRAGDRPGRRASGRSRRGLRVAPDPAVDRRPVSGCLADHCGACLRWRRHAARLWLPCRVPGRAHARVGHHPRRANDRELSPGPGLAGAGRDVPHAGTVGLSRAALLGRGQGHRPGDRAGGRRPPGCGGRRDAAVCLQLARADAVGVGRSARSRSRSCWPPSR